MTGRGTLKVARELVHHPVLQGGAYDKRSAWLWLLSEAAWAARTKTVGTGTIELTRSELVASSRLLAQTWDWEEPKVRRFLDRLETEGMIHRRIVRSSPKDRGITVIGIAKFDDWQASNARRTSDAPSDARPDAPSVDEKADAISINDVPPVSADAPSDAGGETKPTQYIDNKEERKILRFPNSKGEAPPTEWPRDGFDRWYKLYPRKKKPKDARRGFGKLQASSEISFAELMARTERYAAEVKAWPKDRWQFIPYPASWLNGGSYAEEPDEPPESKVATPVRDPQTFTEIEWRDRLRENAKSGTWSRLWGPPPGSLGCIVPAHLIVEPRGAGHG